MFKVNLYDFQEKHEESLLRKCADNEEIVLYAGSRRFVKRKVKRFYNSVVDCFETCVDYRKKGIKNKAKLIAVQKKTENLRVELYNIYGAMHM